MKKSFRNINNDAIFRFLCTYLIILVIIFGCCTVCFRKAFAIVEDNLIEENEYLMKQEITRVEDLFQDAYSDGMEFNSSDVFKNLGNMKEIVQPDYYNATKKVLSKYEDILHRREEWSGNVCAYIPGIDRVIYGNSVYRGSVFQVNYLAKWQLTEEEWYDMRHGKEIFPYLYSPACGDLFYVFPCPKSLQNTEGIGTTMFRIARETILEQMSLLEKYSSCSFFVMQEDGMLISEDGLECSAQLPEECLQKPGTYRLDDKLILNVETDRGDERNYVLVIPQQEALVRLETLRAVMWVIVLAAMIFGVVMAIFFSMKNGKPINQMVHVLKGYDENMEGFDLEGLNDTVTRVVQENKKDRVEMRKIFFHNLLKAEFLSRAEMEYMAAKVELELQKGTYYAAMIRFFPQIDVESIDGITVEESRTLQALVWEKLESLYPLSSWAYKKNTLVTMYVIETEDEKKLLEVLEGITLWLRDEHHADACWGVGTPCRDLMSFWKSAEEAHTVLLHNEKEEAVCCYSDALYHDDTYYLPYSVEDYLVKGLKGGDSQSVHDALQMIQNENFARRSICRKQFMKLNQRICDILAVPLKEADEQEECLIELSGIIAERKGGYQEYFACLESICEDICQYSMGQKNRKRLEKMKDILMFIQENYSNPSMGLGMVSEYCKLSEGYLSAIFKEEMGVNFGEYLEQIRIEKACELLNNGQLVADIAQQTGYNSVQSFRRAFKRVKRVSPSEYRA